MKLNPNLSLSTSILTSIFIFVVSCTPQGGTQKAIAKPIKIQNLLAKITDNLTNNTVLGESLTTEIINKVVEPLENNSYLAISSNTESSDVVQPRILAVNFQLTLEVIIKEILQEQIKGGDTAQLIANVSMVFHTQQPPTPLRTDPTKTFSAVVDQQTQQTQQTVVARAKSLRDLTTLYENVEASKDSKPLSIYNIYPKGALFHNRNEFMISIKDEEEIIYNKTLERFKTISDCPIDHDYSEASVEQIKKEIDAVSGASYLITTSNEDRIFFSISGQQAHEVDKNSWTIWFGHIPKDFKSNVQSTSEIEKRFSIIHTFLQEVNIDTTKKGRIMKYFQ